VPPSVPPDLANFIQTRVVVFLKHWITQGEFSEVLRSRIQTFIANDLETTESLKQMASMLSRAMETPQSNAEESSQFGNAPKPKIPKTISGRLSISDIAPIETARQLTLLTFELYHKLERTEFFHQNWASESRRHRAPNLMSIISHFNQVSKLVTYSILHLDKVRERGKLFSKLIEVAQVKKPSIYFAFSVLYSEFLFFFFPK
jgi:hypothetical protein